MKVEQDEVCIETQPDEIIYSLSWDRFVVLRAPRN